MSIVFYGMIPLLVFVLVDIFANLKWAVIASIVFAVFDVALSYYTLKNLDPGSVLALVALCGLGFLSLRSGDARWVKLQPVIVSVAFALFVAYFQFWGQPVLERYLPFVRDEMPAQMRGYLDNPIFLAKLNRGVTALIGVFLVHAALVAWAAYRMSNWAWLMVRGLGFWVLLVPTAVLVMLP